MNWNIEELNSRSLKCLERLDHARRRGFDPKVIFDVGAYVGKWAKEVHSLYPMSKILLVEPNINLVDAINSNIDSFSNQVVLAHFAAGSKEDTLTLNIWKNPKHNNEVVAFAASSLLTHVQGPATQRLQVDVKTIDWMAKHYNLVPDLLKLDLQGYELEALKGAKECLGRAEMCIIEFGCLDAYQGRTTPQDIMNVMYQYDYVLYDIVDLIYRPYDGALVGGDFFFVKGKSKLKAHKDYF